MIEYLVRRGTLVTVGVLIVLIFGVLAAVRVPMQMIPDLDVRTVTVQTRWPGGATPQDVEKEILIEQEQYLRNLPNLKRMVSKASTGEASIELEFPFGTDINEVLIRVSNALSQVQGYPENVDEPVLTSTSFSSNAFMYYAVTPLPGNPRGVDMNMMRDFVDDEVRTRMERVTGVSEVSLSGGAERQVQIVVDAAKLAQRGLTVAGLRDAVRERNRDVSGGDVESGKRRYALRTVGRFESLEDLGNLIVRREGDTIVRLADVAEVRLGHYELRDRSYSSGTPSLSLAVRRETGSNVIAIKEALAPVTERLNAEVLEPAGLMLSLVSDDVRYVESSVANVWQNLLLGAALASLVLFVFLRSVPTTLVGMSGIPICTVAAFIALLATGRTINVISLAGIAFAIGIAVDNTIVVLENIERQRRRGLRALDASLAGVTEVWPAVLASTLTTVFVFAPVLLVEQEAGQLYSDIAIAIASSILVSMLVALTVVPAACARLPLRKLSDDRAAWAPGSGPILAGVAWLTRSTSRCLACVLASVALTIGALAFLTPPAEYLPEGEEAKTFSMMFAPPGYNLTEMDAIAAELNAEFRPALEEESAKFDRGETSIPALLTFNLGVQPESIMIIAETKDPAHIEALTEVISEKFEGRPGMRGFSTRGSIISSNDGGTRSVNLDISGPDLATVYATALSAFRRAQEVLPEAEINSDPSSLIFSQPLIEVRPRWERASELGFSAEELGYTLAALTDGAFVDEFFLQDDKVDIFLRGPDRTDRVLGRLGELAVASPRGGVVPLGSLADIVETVDTDSIRRVNGRRTVTLNVIPPRSVALETAVGLVRENVVDPMRAAGDLPAGVTIDLSGASDQLMETRAALGGNFLVSAALCYLLLVVIYRHWGHPWIIMATVPLGLAGGIFGLWLLNLVGGWLPAIGLAPIQQPFDMITMLGFLILLGTVVNNPILLVDQSLRNFQQGGLAPARAVSEAVEARLRPILMTTITTVFGLAPLVFLPGAGTELYRGVGAVVLFGLLFSTIVTLTFLPALMTLVLTRFAAPTSPARD
ncbi:MAG: efflux RND transporter permease subunit [Chthoniobacterales bacterium]